MLIPSKKKIVLLGLVTRMPVAGLIWQTIQYMIGFQRLGYDAYYVDACTPHDFMSSPQDDGAERAAAFIARMMGRFGFADRWAFHALHVDGRYYGLSDGRARDLYQSAELIINLHGGTAPRPEYTATGRLVYLETDPVAIEVRLHHGDAQAAEVLDAHVAHFTWGLNYGAADCRVPLSPRYHFHPSPPPVVPELWQDAQPNEPAFFTTVGNWRQPGEVTLDGETYTWSKHHEFLKFLDLPRRTAQPFELALASYGDEDRRLLEGHGWRVRPALGFSNDLDAYRDYVRGSRGEFTVAKDQNVRLRSGWFSERSAQYLAAGRPVITQETGFSHVLPTGEGLFAFATMDDILAAIDAINSDYPRHCRAARRLAREYFHYEVVLKRLLAEVGLPAG